MRYAGIDFGSKRVGVALSDETNTLAIPKTVLPNGPELLDGLKKLFAENRVTEAVVGESRDYSGKDNPIMEKIRVFAERLEKECGVRVLYEPEFMTSAQAGRLQGEGEMLDASAAAIILQSYLDKKKLNA